MDIIGIYLFDQNMGGKVTICFKPFGFLLYILLAETLAQQIRDDPEVEPIHVGTSAHKLNLLQMTQMLQPKQHKTT